MIVWIRRTMYLLLRILTNLEVEGLENVPLEGGGIVATNHLSILDAPLIFCRIQRPDFTALIARKHRKNIAIRWLVERVKGIWIDRYQLELEPLRQMTQVLKKGGLIGIAPEGTRSPTHQIMKAKTGAAYLAAKTGAFVLPAAVTGTEDAVYLWKRLRRPTFKVRFGKPFYLAPPDPKNREAQLEEYTDEIMCRIAAMLPECYRGVYARHPLVQEYLVQSPG